MSFKMIIQDIQIGYYGMMSSIVQSQRRKKNTSSSIIGVNSNLLGQSAMLLEKNSIHGLNIQIAKSEYEKKSSVVA
ncbi:MAG: hypothetical protein ACR2LL_05780 [Nitrosopumilus sp.]|uniref:hypothetical protein n=1 Tax=Nitrosopumilus sp. TaxID=2024843 RepID=UPI00292CB462|nr:hypothetical protein [Nitrosopumilus sp.]